MLHELAAAVEQVAVPVDGFRTVAVDVRQGEFADPLPHVRCRCWSGRWSNQRAESPTSPTIIAS